MPGAVPVAPLAASQPPDNPREVVYLVEIFGLTKSGTMTYTKAEGGSSTDHIPGNLPGDSRHRVVHQQPRCHCGSERVRVPTGRVPGHASTPACAARSTWNGRGFRDADRPGVLFRHVRPGRVHRCAGEAKPVTVANTAGHGQHGLRVSDRRAGGRRRRTGHRAYRAACPRSAVPSTATATTSSLTWSDVQVSWTPGRELDPTSSERIIRVEGVPAIWSASDKGTGSAAQRHALAAGQHAGLRPGRPAHRDGAAGYRPAQGVLNRVRVSGCAWRGTGQPAAEWSALPNSGRMRFRHPQGHGVRIPVRTA